MKESYEAPSSHFPTSRSDGVWNETVRLFPPRPGIRMQTGSVPPEEEEEALRGLGKNIPNGVLIDYWLKEKPKEKEKLTIEILADGKVLRSFSNEKKEKEGRNFWAMVTLTEGRNREIRKVLEHVDCRVSRLIRVSYGPFQIGNLKPAEVREVPRKVIAEQVEDDAAVDAARRMGVDFLQGYAIGRPEPLALAA